MKDLFVRVAAVSPRIRVADPVKNGESIAQAMREAAAEGASVVVFPELCLTGYTCGDLFLQDTLLARAAQELVRLVALSSELAGLFFVGLPLSVGGRLYNVAAAFSGGRLLGYVPKQRIPNYSEFYELRHFAPGTQRLESRFCDQNGQEYPVPVDGELLFACSELPALVVAAEICEDLWAADSPSTSHALAGATVVVNPSASDELTGKADYRRLLVSLQSAKCLCAYVYTSAGEGESSQDLVFGGHCLIAENGSLLAESERFQSGILYADLDLGRLLSERRRMNTFSLAQQRRLLWFSRKPEELVLRRFVDPAPFVPGGQEERVRRCEEILLLQAMGLKTRLEHIGCERVVIGISGGLDSTLALLVTARAFDRLGLPRENICAVTMPCFGTTGRTYKNACEMTRALGASLREVPLREAVLQHFADIGHDPEVQDITYENAQARERTQVLMDLANQLGALVIGTGDMSELALGWATYNGDHMSMYAVNVSVPKTLVRHLIRYYADTCEAEALATILQDVLATPVSPELLPPRDGEIAQKTENIVGPYELHDFFLYYVLRFGYEPRKIYRLAVHAFAGAYEAEEILQWLRTFYRRFFAQQFKRSCLPDGPKIGSVAVSPRGDLRMPSDATVRIWREELEKL